MDVRFASKKMLIFINNMYDIQINICRCTKKSIFFFLILMLYNLVKDITMHGEITPKLLKLEIIKLIKLERLKKKIL